MPNELLIHATGLGALALNVGALIHPCERRLRLHSSLSSLVWAFNNLLLGSSTAAAMCIVSASRSAIAATTLSARRRARTLAFAGFSAVTLAVGAATWNGWSSALILLASLLSTFAMFYLRGARLRLSALVVALLWMHNAWSHDSTEQVLANLLSMAAALYGFIQIELADRAQRRQHAAEPPWLCTQAGP